MAPPIWRSEIKRNDNDEKDVIHIRRRVPRWGEAIIVDDDKDNEIEEEGPIRKKGKIDNQGQILVKTNAQGQLLTAEQLLIVNSPIILEDGVVFKIEAFASSGKSVVIEAFIRARPHKHFLYLVFNKSMKEEAQDKMKGLTNVDVHTYHSLAFHWIIRQLNYSLFTLMMTVDDVKCYNYTQVIIAWMKAPEQNAMYFNFTRIHQLDRVNMWTHQKGLKKLFYYALETLDTFCQSGNNQIEVCHTKKLENTLLVLDRIDHRDAKFYPTIHDVLILARFIWQQITTQKLMIITHTICVKLLHILKPVLSHTYDVIALDEAQDAMPVILAMIKQQNMAVMAVGDTQQQINSWMGAVNAMQCLYQDANENKRYSFTLSEGFRFGSSVADLCNLMFQTFKYALPAPIRSRSKHQTRIEPLTDKSIEELTEEMLLRITTLNTKKLAILTYSKFAALLFIDAWMTQLEDMRIDMGYFQLKCSASLKSSLIHLCTLGSNTAAELNNQVQLLDLQIIGDQNNEETGNKKQMVIHLLNKKNRESYAKALSSLINPKAAFPTTIVLELSTIHAAKGLEYDHVVIVDPTRSFKTNIDNYNVNNPPTHLKNPVLYLLYVAITRCKLSLHISETLYKKISGIIIPYKEDDD